MTRETSTFVDLPASAGGSGAVTRAGGNTTEATTTSITAVDLLSAASLSIAVATPVLLMVALRKTTGAAALAYWDIKLNTTLLQGSTANSWSSAANSIQSGFARVLFMTFLTNYPMMVQAVGVASGTIHQTGTSIAVSINNDAPNATLTDIAISGKVADALVTMGADDSHVYTYAVS